MGDLTQNKGAPQKREKPPQKKSLKEMKGGPLKMEGKGGDPKNGVAPNKRGPPHKEGTP